MILTSYYSISGEISSFSTTKDSLRITFSKAKEGMFGSTERPMTAVGKKERWMDMVSFSGTPEDTITKDSTRTI